MILPMECIKQITAASSVCSRSQHQVIFNLMRAFYAHPPRGHLMWIPTKRKQNFHKPRCVFSPWANRANLMPFVLNSMTYLFFFLVPEILKKLSSAYTRTPGCVWSSITADTSRSFSTEPAWWSTSCAITEPIRMVSCVLWLFRNAVGKAGETG